MNIEITQTCIQQNDVFCEKFNYQGRADFFQFYFFGAMFVFIAGWYSVVWFFKRK